jgi:hypothetical protein
VQFSRKAPTDVSEVCTGDSFRLDIAFRELCRFNLGNAGTLPIGRGPSVCARCTIWPVILPVRGIPVESLHHAKCFAANTDSSSDKGPLSSRVQSSSPHPISASSRRVRPAAASRIRYRWWGNREPASEISGDVFGDHGGAVGLRFELNIWVSVTWNLRDGFLAQRFVAAVGSQDVTQTCRRQRFTNHAVLLGRPAFAIPQTIRPWPPPKFLFPPFGSPSAGHTCE